MESRPTNSMLSMEAQRPEPSRHPPPTGQRVGDAFVPTEPDLEPEMLQSSHMIAKHKIEGALGDISGALVCISLPMIILTGVFLGLVYTHLVPDAASLSNDIFGPLGSYDQSAYYVDYSAPRLITVSSWLSTVASLTSGMIMTLVSYPLAKAYLRESRPGSWAATLPTAYQLRLIIDLMGGSLKSLWSLLQYSYWRKRNDQPRILWMAAGSLLGATCLSLAIFGVDTWLHVTTSTVPYDGLAPSAVQPTAAYGRDLEPLCYNTTYPAGSSTQCIGHFTSSQIVFLGGPEASRTMLNLSTTNAVLPCILDGRSFAFLTSAQRNLDIDYQATTFAIGTTCKPASKACDLHSEYYCALESGCYNGQSQLTEAVRYNCSTSLYGDLNNNTGSPFGVNGTNGGQETNNGFFLQLFREDGFLDPIGLSSSQDAGVPNPLHFAVGGHTTTSDALATDSEAVGDVEYSDRAFIFSCATTVFELKYTVVNGTVVNGTYSPTNATLTQNLRWVLDNSPATSLTALVSAFLSGAQQANTSQEFGDIFAQSFSEIALSSIVGITVPSVNTLERTRQQLLVARLPKAPFFTLIVLSLLYALLGIGFAGKALASQPKITRELQARLSVAGLVAALLESKRAESPSADREAHSRGNNGRGGIESVYAEYYNGGDDGRIALSMDGKENNVFEKVFPDKADEAGKG